MGTRFRGDNASKVFSATQVCALLFHNPAIHAGIYTSSPFG
jgi:hypothetical protein